MKKTLIVHALRAGSHRETRLVISDFTSKILNRRGKSLDDKQNSVAF